MNILIPAALCLLPYFQVRELLTQVRVIKVLVAVAFTAKLRSGNKSFEATHY
jgi:hypothetical protein